MNKKLKKKRIPECNDAYKEALIKKVLDADVVYEWEHVLVQKYRWLGCIPGALLGIVFAVLTDDFWSSVGIAVFVMIMCAFIYFIGCANRDYLCQITPYGIRRYETERVPEVFYKATRGLAYVGIVICVVAVIFIGPMAFVGAGGSALMAFKMRHFHKNTETYIVPFATDAEYHFYSDESSFDNDIVLLDHTIPSYSSETDSNLTNLKSFHWIGVYCKEEHISEINDVISQYITTRPKIFKKTLASEQ
ncbi:hypothetical protein MHO82_18215 [Vibrio sp. Of7-15]|uniref:hypothetical protein n=1 Tax=Vibrio sp. Of7-15 TaxID=2724879 RepID=UPI001EF357AA|nr:hypothetical protein [Vibrio sp. Of7-15]MCG7498807.1 hypothetical protein [Vibrio sp. Of7-15]